VTALSEVATAEQIARQAHEGQKDTVTGADYITHVERVVALVSDEAKATAWLHDVLEDSCWTEFDLRAAGISARTVSAVVWLTRTPPYDYATYIDRLIESGDALAIAVKIADLSDHLRPDCPSRLRTRYEKAMVVLTTQSPDKEPLHESPKPDHSLHQTARAIPARPDRD